MWASRKELSKRVNVAVTATAVMLLLQASLSAAGPFEDVPEIDGSSVAAGLGLLGAGLLWLRARRRVK